jgi:signal transduction histidine kinase
MTGMSGVRRWPALGATGRDAGLAALAAIVPLVLVLTDDRGLTPGTRLLWAVLAVTACAVLAARRRYPLAVAAACALASVAAAVVSGRDATFLVVVLAIGSAAFHTERRWVLAAGSIAWTATFAILGGGPTDPLAITLYVGLAIAPVSVGLALRLQLDRAVDLALLRQARGQAADWAQLARDVHDAVGHQLSAIHVQALGGRRALHRDPAGAERALDAVAELSGQALGEVRELLDRIRDGVAGSPGLPEVPALAARLGSDQLVIDLAVDAGPVRPAVEACAYRVVQESLTNVVRHSAAARAEVRVLRSGADLVVTVEDDGPARRPGRRGSRPAGGVVGMRERVTGLGGTFSAGPNGAGWRVHAALPLSPAAP